MYRHLYWEIETANKEAPLKRGEIAVIVCKRYVILDMLLWGIISVLWYFNCWLWISVHVIYWDIYWEFTMLPIDSACNIMNSVVSRLQKQHINHENLRRTVCQQIQIISFNIYILNLHCNINISPLRINHVIFTYINPSKWAIHVQSFSIFILVSK